MNAPRTGAPAADGDPIRSLPDHEVQALRTRVHGLMPGVLDDLCDLVRVPGVSAPSHDGRHLATGAERVADLFRGAGLPDVRVVAEGGAPAVIARRPAPDGAPTVLLYAHHDVQPAGDPALWTSPPFEPAERDGRLYGRGTADDKAGIALHLACLRALADRPGPGVTVFVEGEEEIGSPSFPAILARHHDLLACDVIVVADSVNPRVGVPGLTTSLRGVVTGIVEVSTLEHAVHSGFFGGPVLDAMTATVRLLSTLWDERGDLAVPGLRAGPAGAGTVLEEEGLRRDAGVLPGVGLVGTGSLESRLWTRPALTLIGIDAPGVDQASNTLLPRVRAVFSLRVAPGQDPDDGLAAVREHLLAAAPWGARVTVRGTESGSGWEGDVTSPVYGTVRHAFRQAWGVEPVRTGVGGSIPFIPEFRRAFPGAVVVVTGVEDPDTRAHGIDESLHLGDFERACLAQTLLLAALARGGGPDPS